MAQPVQTMGHTGMAEPGTIFVRDAAEVCVLDWRNGAKASIVQAGIVLALNEPVCES